MRTDSAPKPIRLSKFRDASTSSRRIWKAFHAEESGLGTVEMILLLFAAVVILIALIALFNSEVWPQVKAKIKSLLGMSPG